MGYAKIMVLRTHDLSLRQQDAKIDLKFPILYFRKSKEAHSEIYNGEIKIHGAETSGPTLETLRCKN